MRERNPLNNLHLVPFLKLTKQNKQKKALHILNQTEHFRKNVRLPIVIHMIGHPEIAVSPNLFLNSSIFDHTAFCPQGHVVNLKPSLSSTHHKQSLCLK